MAFEGTLDQLFATSLTLSLVCGISGPWSMQVVHPALKCLVTSRECWVLHVFSFVDAF